MIFVYREREPVYKIKVFWKIFIFKKLSVNLIITAIKFIKNVILLKPDKVNLILKLLQGKKVPIGK